jgi:excisionase family DNA binding protein
MDMTTREAAERLSVHQSRIRALIHSGTLDARRVGSQWLLDADSVDRQADFTSAKATGRPMARRVAWAASDLADGGQARWVSASDRTRLRHRLDDVSNTAVVQKWLRARAATVTRYRVGDDDIHDLLSAEGVVATGVSAADAYGLSLGAGGSADGYVTKAVRKRLEGDFVLIRSRTGNLTLRLVNDGAPDRHAAESKAVDDLHLRSSHQIEGHLVAARLIVGADLADDTDTRTKSAGRALIQDVLSEHQWRLTR